MFSLRHVGRVLALVVAIPFAGKAMACDAWRVEGIWVEHNVCESDEIGMRIHLSMELYGARGWPCNVSAYFQLSNGLALLDFDGNYATADGKVAVGWYFVPAYDGTRYDDVTLFIPYTQLHMQRGSLSFQVVLRVRTTRGWQALYRTEEFWFQVWDR